MKISNNYFLHVAPGALLDRLAHSEMYHFAEALPVVPQTLLVCRVVDHFAEVVIDLIPAVRSKKPRILWFGARGYRLHFLK